MNDTLNYESLPTPSNAPPLENAKPRFVESSKGAQVTVTVTVTVTITITVTVTVSVTVAMAQSRFCHS